MAKKIMIVDDEASIRESLAGILSDEGYIPVPVESAEKALEALNHEKIHLVLLDIWMPAMDGLEAIGKILGLKKDIPIILNTAYSNYKEDFMSWAADAYVVKSSDLTQLKNTIRNVLDKKKSPA